MRKPEVRELAERLHFINARKHDSQDICFVPDGDYASFMEQYTGKRYPEGGLPGRERRSGGQASGRCALYPGPAERAGPCPGGAGLCLRERYGGQHGVGWAGRALYADSLLAEDVNWIAIPKLEGPMRFKAKTRYRQREQWATVYPVGEKQIRLRFDVPQRAMTVGQAVVLYDGDIVVGGGTITQVSGQRKTQAAPSGQRGKP